MPALPYIGAAVGVAGAVNANNANNTAASQTAAQVALEAEKFGWTKEQAAQELARRTASSNKYWGEYDKTAAPTYAESVTQASNELTPQYDTQMKESLDQTNQGLMSRGFFGQAPGAALAQEAAAKVLTAKNNAINQMANQFYQTGQDRQLQQKQLGMNTFGTYGVSEPPVVPVAPNIVAPVQSVTPSGVLKNIKLDTTSSYPGSSGSSSLRSGSSGSGDWSSGGYSQYGI